MPRLFPFTLRAVGKANLAFWAFWLFALLWCSRNSYDDPSSIFYNRKSAYTERYSAIRKIQVDNFLKQQNTTSNTYKGDGKFLCIGIPSINRTSEGFLAHTIGSFVDTLEPAQRQSIHIVVLLADTSPQKHFAYGQKWLTNLVDEVLIYGGNESSSFQKDGYRTIPFNIRDDGQPRGSSRVENIRLDHSVLVETCRKKGSQYFAFVEDDVIAAPNWYRKFSDGVGYLEDHHHHSPEKDWMYLRLFYSELFMGWNAEEWPVYLEVIFIIYVVVFAVFFEMRRRRRRNRSSAGYTKLPGNQQQHQQTFNHIAAMAIGLWMPAAIALFFLAGRITLHRLSPFPWSGVREMPKYGCCSQALVFPNRHLAGFEKLLRTPPFDFPGDMMLEGYASDQGLKKWALDPSVVQHVGLKQSSDGPRIAEVWNFSFERQQA